MERKFYNAFPVLKTERLTLRRLRIEDAPEIFTLRSDSEINKYLGRQPSNSIDDAKSFIQKINASIDAGASFYWAITFNDNNLFAGTICLFNFSDDNKKCEIGYELLTNFQRQGIMKEAVEKVIDFSFTTMNVQTIEACCHRENVRSLQLLNTFSFEPINELDNAEPELICYCLTNSNHTQ